MINKIPNEFVELLGRRGINDAASIEKFLMPSLADLPHPGQMKNLEKAVEVILQYVVSPKRIIVWGDYDVDGTTGTSLLVNFFQQIGVNVEWHIPNRFDEGYGLNIEWFLANRDILGSDFLVITVDCGISNQGVIESISNFGGTVIVTDHHAIPPDGPPQCIVVNPSQHDCGFHGEALAGVGVAFYLAVGLRAKIRDTGLPGIGADVLNLKQYLPFVALGTIADVVNLSRTNRILVRAGLEAMESTDFPGVKALLRACDIYGAINSEDIGFLLGPTINAAGRLGEGALVVELLTEKKQTSASVKAQRLKSLNNRRKGLCEDNLELALSLTGTTDCCVDMAATILADEFHLGVAGIVAAKLVEKTGVPAIVLGENLDQRGRKVFTGSARSVESVNIIECLNDCNEFLERYGGHKMAAGLTVLPQKFEDFCRKFKEVVKNHKKDLCTGKKHLYDVKLSAEKLLSPQYLEVMKLFEPFGPGNEMPVFYDPEAMIYDAKRVGRNAEHLQITLRGRYANIKGIGFGLGDRINSIQSIPTRRIHYSPTINRYRGTTSWQIRVIDL